MDSELMRLVTQVQAKIEVSAVVAQGLLLSLQAELCQFLWHVEKRVQARCDRNRLFCGRVKCTGGGPSRKACGAQSPQSHGWTRPLRMWRPRDGPSRSV